MPEYKVPLDKQVVELESGKMLIPGEKAYKLSTKEYEDNKDLIKLLVLEGALLEVEGAKGGDK